MTELKDLGGTGPLANFPMKAYVLDGAEFPRARRTQGSLTKKRFEALLMKAAQPLPKKKPVPRDSRTLEPRPSDGCSETRTNQDNLEGKRD